MNRKFPYDCSQHNMDQNTETLIESLMSYLNQVPGVKSINPMPDSNRIIVYLSRTADLPDTWKSDIQAIKDKSQCTLALDVQYGTHWGGMADALTRRGYFSGWMFT